MTHAEYIVAGYSLTFIIVIAYTVLLARRVRAAREAARAVEPAAGTRT